MTSVQAWPAARPCHAPAREAPAREVETVRSTESPANVWIIDSARLFWLIGLICVVLFSELNEGVGGKGESTGEGCSKDS